MKPLAVDLCCGMGGWTEGLQQAGWDTVGFDLVALPEYHWPLILQDVRTLDGHRLRQAGAQLIVASPPCTEFSKWDKPLSWFPNRKPPCLDLATHCYRIAREAGSPLVLENVRGARPWLGYNASRYQSWYLWGDGVPVLLPASRWGGKNWRGRSNWDRRGPQRRARIPLELALWVAEYHYPRPTEPRSPADSS